jgi:hypothetical protein
MMMYVFNCAECGDSVVSFTHQVNLDQPQVCAICQWLLSIADPDEREKVRSYIHRHRTEQGGSTL